MLRLCYRVCHATALGGVDDQLTPPPLRSATLSQALAKDKLYPYIHFFAKGYGANQDPFRGYVIVFIVAEACVLIGG